MGKYDKIDLFENFPIPKAVMTLTVPMVAACLVMILYNLADTFFVGFLNDPIETSAVTLAAPVLLAFNAVINLFGIGCASLISRALGVKDLDTVKRTSSFGFWGAVAAGLLFSIICSIFKPFLLTILGTEAVNEAATSGYMFWTVTLGAIPSILNMVMGQIVRSEGSALKASLGTVGGCVLNIFLDPVFIMPWGLGMGAAGAGCATFISNCAACLYYILLLIIKKNESVISISLNDLKINRTIIKEVCGVGVPAAIQNLLNVTGMTILNNIMSVYGAPAVSAMGIAHKIAMIPMYVAMGIGNGVMPLIGYNYAANNKKRMKDGLVFTLKIASGFMIAVAVLFVIFSKSIIGLFMQNELVVEYGGAFLIGQALAQPFLGLDFLGVGVFQACGMGKKSFIFAILRKVVFEIPALYLLNRLFPMYGLAYAALSAEVILAVVSAFELKKNNGFAS